jgi:hypothetical protein
MKQLEAALRRQQIRPDCAAIATLVVACAVLVLRVNHLDLPAVRAAAEAIRSAAVRVKLEHPEMTPLEQLQAARARCTDVIVEANVAIRRAEERQLYGPLDMTAKRGHSAGEKASVEKVQKAAKERWEKIRKVAGANPGWSRSQIADACEVSLATVRRALGTVVTAEARDAAAA